LWLNVAPQVAAALDQIGTRPRRAESYRRTRGSPFPKHDENASLPMLMVVTESGIPSDDIPMQMRNRVVINASDST
jgi:hypothetical protein